MLWQLKLFFVLYCACQYCNNQTYTVQPLCCHNIHIRALSTVLGPFTVKPVTPTLGLTVVL